MRNPDGEARCTGTYSSLPQLKAVDVLHLKGGFLGDGQHLHFLSAGQAREVTLVCIAASASGGQRASGIFSCS